MDVTESNKIVIIGSSGNCNDKIIKKLPFKNSNGIARYLISKARLAFTQLRKTFTKTPIL